jgi:hypothetical protein
MWRLAIERGLSDRVAKSGSTGKREASRHAKCYISAEVRNSLTQPIVPSLRNDDTTTEKLAVTPHLAASETPAFHVPNIFEKRPHDST